MLPSGALWVCLLLFTVPGKGLWASAVEDSPSPAIETLLQAVRKGSLPEIAASLDAGTDVNGRDGHGSTALLEASWSGNVEVAKLLIARGAEVNAAHRETGATPLEYAVITSKPALVDLLLNAGADPNRKYRNRQTVLHMAAARRSPEIVDRLLRANAELEALDIDENAPLNEAVLHHQPDALKCLLQHGAAVNRVRPSDGRAAIHQACTKGFADLIPILLAAGADPVLKDRFGQTPLDLALAYKSKAAIAELLKVSSNSPETREAAERAMDTAALKGQTEIVQLLLQSGFDVNRPTATGSTYLHDAALKNQAKVAQLLIEAGARLNALNQSGGTPLHDASLGGSTDVIRVLLQKGAAIDARDRESGATPLMLAASLGRSSAVELLLKCGAARDLTDRFGRTALDRARQNDDVAIMRLLSSTQK